MDCCYNWRTTQIIFKSVIGGSVTGTNISRHERVKMCTPCDVELIIFSLDNRVVCVAGYLCVRVILL